MSCGIFASSSSRSSTEVTSRPSSKRVDSSSESAAGRAVPRASAAPGAGSLMGGATGSSGSLGIILSGLTTPLTLPLEYEAIARILPHRYPFLLVDRITELEPDSRIVGIKNVSHDESYLSHAPGEPPSMPPTILTECVAQVGAILILSKPKNLGKLILFRGMERVR